MLSQAQGEQTGLIPKLRESKQVRVEAASIWRRCSEGVQCHFHLIIWSEQDTKLFRGTSSWDKLQEFSVPWMEEPGGLQSMGSLRVGHDWVAEQLHFSLSCIGEGNGNPLQCSCLENPRDRGAWWAAIYGVAHSWTRLKWLSSSSSSHANVLCLNGWAVLLSIHKVILTILFPLHWETILTIPVGSFN